MAHIVYTAKRSIIDAHSAETEYEFEIDLGKFDRSTKREQETSSSLVGVRFTVLHRIDVFYSATTAPVNSSSDIDQMREFLDSVAGGEEFTIDPMGTILTPDNPRTLTIDGDYTESQVGESQYYTFSFKGVEV